MGSNAALKPPQRLTARVYPMCYPEQLDSLWVVKRLKAPAFRVKISKREKKKTKTFNN